MKPQLSEDRNRLRLKMKTNGVLSVKHWNNKKWHVKHY